MRQVKRTISILLIFAYAVGLCACGTMEGSATAQSGDPSQSGGAASGSSTAMSDGEMYTYLDQTSIFPFGTNGKVTGIEVNGDYIYACGSSDDEALFCRIAYKEIDGTMNFGSSEAITLPVGEDIHILGISSDVGNIYIITGKQSEDGTYDAYTVYILDSYSNIVNAISVDFPRDDLILGIAATGNGQFWIYGAHNLVVYTGNGMFVGSIADYTTDFCPPVVIDSKLYIQVQDYRSAFPTMYIADAASSSLTVIANAPEIAPNVSCVQATTDFGIINDGTNVYSIDADMQYASILEWYSLTLDYGYKYTSICHVDDGVFFAVPDSSAEIVCLSIRQKTDNRIPITIAFYGQATETMDTVHTQFDRYSTEYKVECVDYGSDEAGLNRLLTDLNSGRSFDLIVSDGQINPQSGFVDLYPLIDADSELSREDFVSEILAGLESRGELNEIWGSFIIGTLQAMGLSAQSGSVLSLAEIPGELNAAGYDGTLFDSFYTKEHLLDCMIPGILKSAYNEASSSYILDNGTARSLIELCDVCPLEFSFENETDLENLRFSEVLQWKEFGGVDAIDVLEQNSENGFMYFDGRNGGDNFTKLACTQRECYMIPKSCTDVGRAWGFLRTLLTSEWQVKHYADRKIGLPICRDALNTVLTSCLSENQVSEAYYMIGNGTVMSYTQTAISEIVTDGLRGYFSGAVDLDSALATTQSKLNIFISEQRG